MVRYLLKVICDHQNDKYSALKVLLLDLKDVKCHVCGGDGHTARYCGTLARIQHSKKGNMPLKSAWNEVYTIAENELHADNNADKIVYHTPCGRLKGIFLPKMSATFLASMSDDEIGRTIQHCPNFVAKVG